MRHYLLQFVLKQPAVCCFSIVYCLLSISPLRTRSYLLVAVFLLPAAHCFLIVYYKLAIACLRLRFWSRRLRLLFMVINCPGTAFG